MTTAKSWAEFRDSGLLWWINMNLHIFGWSIVIEIEDDKIINAYPARVKFRGFSPELNDEGYVKVTNFLENNISELTKEANDG